MPAAEAGAGKACATKPRRSPTCPEWTMLDGAEPARVFLRLQALRPPLRGCGERARHDERAAREFFEANFSPYALISSDTGTAA